MATSSSRSPQLAVLRLLVAAGVLLSSATAPAEESLCSAGIRDGFSCAQHADCPDGACVLAQGVCDAGPNDGLPCDCPGGTCIGSGVDPTVGTCRAGTSDGEPCDPTSECATHPCTGTQQICVAGTMKGASCLRDDQCYGGACSSTGKICIDGTDFAGSSCADDADCCVNPSRCSSGNCASARPPVLTATPAPSTPFPTTTATDTPVGTSTDIPTATPSVTPVQSPSPTRSVAATPTRCSPCPGLEVGGQSETGDGCSVSPPPHSGCSRPALIALALFAWRRLTR
jgi:hypothetical protein